MPEVTKNYVRIPVRNPKSDAEIKTITINAKEGIKALYDSRNKEIVTYLFARPKWTMKKARKWLEDHYR